MDFATWLQRKIEGKGLSLRGAAAYIGISPPALSALLKGRSRPRPATLRKIANHFRTDLDYLYEMLGYKPHEHHYDIIPELDAEVHRLDDLSPEEQKRMYPVLHAVINICSSRDIENGREEAKP
ncbi:MAG: helix-turn-helix transcriptional regulator [Bacteroidota bacterium]